MASFLMLVSSEKTCFLGRVVGLRSLSWAGPKPMNAKTEWLNKTEWLQRMKKVPVS
jgi:hypothetical protein